MALAPVRGPLGDTMEGREGPWGMRVVLCQRDMLVHRFLAS